uniref:Lig_chan-Glu_bd domain-containing protein n=1 Tax=Heterorhabditis bacteriophora TaxID=37862 RepID=A0A1I7X0U5_HETBA
MAPPIEHQIRPQFLVLFNQECCLLIFTLLFGAAILLLSANHTISMQPTASCRNSDGPPSWDNGAKLYEVMKSAYVKGNPFHVDDGYDSFFYTFNKFGKLKNSILQISNLRKHPKGGYYWDKFIFQNNSWNGLIADLINNKADMCVTSLKLNSDRARDIDFSLPFLETGIAIIVKIRSGVLSPTAFLGGFNHFIASQKLYQLPL